MKRLKLQMVCFVLWVSLLCHKIELCVSLNDEGMKGSFELKEMIEDDPFGALLDWNKNDIDACSWFGVECSHDRRIIALNLKDLGLKGMLAPELGKLLHLRTLNLHNNSFYGVVPRELGDLQKLEVLDLGHNNLTGTIPSEIGNILSLEFLILTGNRFSGEMSPELRELNLFSEIQADEGLVLSSKELAIRNIKNATIRRILLAIGDNLSHKIGMRGFETFSKPTMRQTTENADISTFPRRDSNAEASPTVPSVNTFSPSHSPLSEPPSPASPPETSPHSQSNDPPVSSSRSLSPQQPPSDVNHRPPPPPSNVFPPPPPLPPSDISATHQRKHAVYWIVLASLGGALCLTGALLAMYLLCRRKHRVGTVTPWATGLSGQLQKAFVTGVPSLRRAELEAACEDFSNVIGNLSDHKLYKGTLSNGTEIAVTSTLAESAAEWSQQSEAQFRKKVFHICFVTVNHKNFMNLLGYCEEDEPFTRMVVFEYASNGTLFEHLHIKEAEPLDWHARLRIAMGVIYCLEYMHQLNPPINLRNLNSSSIYLTEDCAAKVSDLGFWIDEKKETGPDDDGSDEESAVYKFAILLLEMISGRLPFSEDDGLLVLWASSYLNGKRPLMTMVDPTLNSVPEEHISRLCEVVRSCIKPESEGRPTVAEVARQMRQITGIAPAGAVPSLNAAWWAELEIISSGG
uniref:Protein kinase domain-containing protein n=1 Tax=Ananas comosus var. bracteatus TaxID=296719 RepID=A0A6V7QRF3_ANACO